MTSFEENRRKDWQCQDDNEPSSNVKGQILNDFWSFNLETQFWEEQAQIIRKEWPPRMYKGASGILSQLILKIVHTELDFNDIFGFMEE